MQHFQAHRQVGCTCAPVLRFVKYKYDTVIPNFSTYLAASEGKGEGAAGCSTVSESKVITLPVYPQLFFPDFHLFKSHLVFNEFMKMFYTQQLCKY